MKRLCLAFLAAANFCAAFCFAQNTNAHFRGLAGFIYEAEDWSTPRDWLTNQVSATKWRLWTTEGKGKRSRDASLTTPKIERDRATPEEGAPVLHTHITGIPRGLYRAWLGGTTRPLAYSLDAGRTWLKSAGGETDLGVHDIKDGAFDLWADDRHANPANIGSAYYDYIRLVPFVPPTLSQLAAFTLADGSTQISWISSEPTPAAVVECDGREFTETESDQRNHRVALTGLSANTRYEARIRCLGATAAPVKFIAGQQPRIRRSKPHTVELAVTEPTDAPRKNWPVTSGVPFARGALASAEHARLFDASGKQVPAQFEATAFWPDGSVKWLQLSFCTDTARDAVKLQLQICRGTEATPPSQTVGIHEDADTVIVKNGPLSLRVGKEKFAVFDGLPSVGEPKGGNGRILDANGKAYFLGKPDDVMIEERGPIRAVVRAEGDFVAEDGAKLFRWRARYLVCAGQPWVRLSWTIGNNATNAVLTNLQAAGFRIPLAASGPVRGAFDGAPAAEIKDDSGMVLLQNQDDHFTVSANGQQTRGKQSAGWATVTDGKHRIEAVVKDFWQLYPKGIAIKPDGLHIRVLPPLPADAFAKESQRTEDLIRLYYCYDRGQYRVKRGLEFTTDIYARFGGDDAGKFATWANNPLFAVASPQHYCDSGVFGVVEPRQPGVFDSYEWMADDGFAQLERNRQQKREYGWMNFGDWHGERHFNWGNHEYDMMGALALQFIRTGEMKWLRRAEEATRHSTDIDTVHYPWQARTPGRVYAHSVGHVGGFFDMSDPQFQRLGNVFGLSDVKRPNPFVAGAIDAGGHIFQPGNFRVGFLTGERHYREVAGMACAAQAAYMTRNFSFGIERGAGWPLMNAVAAYEATSNPFFLNAARLYVEKIIAKQTERGDWNLKHGPPECLHQPSHPGGKAFATGVLLNGLMMFDAVAPSREVKQCIVHSAHWLEKYSWNHETHGFRYIDTCPTFDKGRGNGGTDFLVSSGLAYACTLDRDPALKALLFDSLGRALRSTAKAGKDFIMDIRQTPHALAILHQRFGIKELPEPAPASSRPK
ncbi:MAG: fibronectin type III domain-containing protein [Verrucomicrobia bacterium]|nr:fibronectin type III domain-containing protein [Verrucomicrobiota bacterium]